MGVKKVSTVDFTEVLSNEDSVIVIKDGMLKQIKKPYFGTEQQLQVSGDWIQWRASSIDKWKNLVSISSLTNSAVPNLTIGTIETVPVGTTPSATITGTSKNPVLNLKLPKGDTSEQQMYGYMADVVNSGYHTVVGNSYSGPASDMGIEFGRVDGISVQNGTPTPQTPVPVESWTISEIATHSYQLFDASKLPSTSQGGAIVTNNGDGSFTISGSGNLTETFYVNYVYSHEETMKLIKKGTIRIGQSNVVPRIWVTLRDYDAAGKILLQLSSLNLHQTEITSEMLAKKNLKLEISIAHEKGAAIVSGIVKPMLYQDGDGTWESFKQQTITLSKPTILRGIKSEQGNTTINGQKYISDILCVKNGIIGVERNIKNILSYTSEQVKHPFMSSTGQLTQGANVICTQTSVFEPIEQFTIPSFYPNTTVTTNANLQTNITWHAKTFANQKYTERFFKQFFALQRSGKVYTVKFPMFEKSTSPLGEKLDNNKGLVCEPSTDTIVGKNDYENIPLFKTYDVNAIVDSSGKIRVTAMKGDGAFQDIGKVDVFVLGMSYYEKTWNDGTYWYYSRTDMPREGYTLAQEFHNVDGTQSSYALYSKYVSGEIDGQLYSSKGLIPKRAMSYNTCESLYHKKGAYYSGGHLSLYKYVTTTFWLKYATLNSNSIIGGCFSYNYQNVCVQGENNVKRVIIPTTQANNYIIGSRVSIGDKGSNSSLDRNNTYMHNKCDSVVITKIEPIDGTNSAIYVDTPTTFNTNATTYITTMHWHSGTSDLILGRDGCIGSLTAMKTPMVIQGIELAVGGYEVAGNAFMDIINANLEREVYITNDPSKITTDVNKAKANYNKSKFIMKAKNKDAWNYVTHMGIDIDNGATIITGSGETGSGSGTGYCDGYYLDGAASGQREFLLLGNLGYGSHCGLSYLTGSHWLPWGHWDFLARLSVNGVKG